MTDDNKGNDSNDSDRPLDRRSILKYGGSGALSVGLAGCQSPENPVEPAVFRPAGTSDPPENGEPEGLEGPLEGETYRIGVLAPMDWPLGESMWNAARMAAEDLNDEGGMLGAHVDVELADTELSPGTADAEHQRLVIQEDCDMTMGIFMGSALVQTMPSIANQETIHVTTASAEPRVGRLVSRSQSFTDDDPEEEYERFKYHFRAGPIHLLDLADAMMEFVERNMDDLGWERAALLTENVGEYTPYHDRLAEQLDEVIDVPYTERPGGVSDWRPIYDQIEAEDCDVALVGMALIGTTAVNQWAQQERPFEFGGVHVPSQRFDYWESTEGNVEYVWTMNSMTPQTENTELTQGFVEQYMETWDSVPIYSGTLTYDAISMMDQAIEACLEGEGIETIPDSETLVPYIEETTFTGGRIIDEIQFTPPDAEFAHEPQWTSIEETGVPVFQQWQYDEDVREDYGTMHSFAPEQNQTADYQVPDWFDD